MECIGIRKVLGKTILSRGDTVQVVARNKYEACCPVLYVALFTLYRIHMTNHGLPDLLGWRDMWYGEYLLYAGSPREAMLKQTHEKQYRTFMQNTDIQMPGFNLNLARHAMPVELQGRGATDDQIEGQGGWKRDMKDRYTKTPNVLPVVMGASFMRREDYVIPR